MINGSVTLVLMILLVGKVIGDCSFENKQSIITCYDDYFASISIIGEIMSYDDYFQALSIRLDTRNKAEVLCQAFNNHAHDCIVKAKATGCMNICDFGSIQAIWNNNQSANYAINYHLLEYMCGQGFTAFNLSYECLSILPYKIASCHAINGDCNSRVDQMACFSSIANYTCGNNARTFVSNLLQIYQKHSCQDCSALNSAFRVDGTLLLTFWMIYSLLMFFKL